MQITWVSTGSRHDEIVGFVVGVIYSQLPYLLTYLLTYSITYLLTPQSRVLLEKLTGSQLVKFPAF